MAPVIRIGPGSGARPFHAIARMDRIGLSLFRGFLRRGNEPEDVYLLLNILERHKAAFKECRVVLNAACGFGPHEYVPLNGR